MAPEIVGEVGLSNGSVDIRRAGISVTEIELLLRQSKAGEVALKGPGQIRRRLPRHQRQD